MKSPFYITRTIVLSQSEYGIPSEKYILNHLSEFMEQFGMDEQRLNDQELMYRKMDPFQSFSRRDLIRNLQVRAECEDGEIRITLKTEIILLLALVLVASVGILILQPAIPFPFYLVLFVGLIFVPFVVKLTTLNTFKEEFLMVMNGLKRDKQ